MPSTPRPMHVSPPRLRSVRGRRRRSRLTSDLVRRPRVERTDPGRGGRRGRRGSSGMVSTRMRYSHWPGRQWSSVARSDLQARGCAFGRPASAARRSCACRSGSSRSRRGRAAPARRAGRRRRRAGASRRCGAASAPISPASSSISSRKPTRAFCTARTPMRLPVRVRKNARAIGASRRACASSSSRFDS